MFINWNAIKQGMARSLRWVMAAAGFLLLVGTGNLSPSLGGIRFLAASAK